MDIENEKTSQDQLEKICSSILNTEKTYLVIWLPNVPLQYNLEYKNKESQQPKWNHTHQVYKSINGGAHKIQTIQDKCLNICISWV